MSRRIRPPAAARHLLFLAALLLVFSPAFAATAHTASVSPTIVSTDQNVSFIFNVTNTGGEGITAVKIDLSPFNSGGSIVSDSIACPASLPLYSLTSPGGGAPPLLLSCYNGTLAPLSSAIIRFNFTSAPAAPGTAAIPVFSLNATNFTVNTTASVQIQAKVQLAASVVTPIPVQVSKGQTNVWALFRIVNQGGATALNVIPSVAVQAANQVLPAAVFPATIGSIAGGGSGDFNVSFTVLANTTQGPLTVSFSANATDQNSQLNTTSNPMTSLSTVLNPPSLTVASTVSNVTFLSNNPNFRTARVTVQVQNAGSSSTTAPANLTSKHLYIVNGQGANLSSQYVIVDTDSVVQIGGGALETLTFDVTASGATEGPRFGNVSVSYFDGISGIGQPLTTGNNATLFTVDNTMPSITVISPQSNSHFRQGETVFVNATVFDTSSGVGDTQCTVTVGGIPTALNVSYSSGACSGNVLVPNDVSLFGTEPLVVSIPDAVGNLGTGSRDVVIYTLVVNTTDKLNGDQIKSGPDLSDATVYAQNTSGAGQWQCTVRAGTNSHLCPVPLGTIVNITAFSPAYVRNNVTVDASRMCVGSGTVSSCNATLPAGGANNANILLDPNTKVVVTDQFGNQVPFANITVRDSAVTPWQKNFQDGTPMDHNGTADGVLIFPLDISMHTSPFTISFNANLSHTNPGYLMVQQAGVSPNNITQAAINITANFTIFLKVSNEFGQFINTSTGAVSFAHKNATIFCRQNQGNFSQYGCPVPTVAEDVNLTMGLASGGNLTVAKPGYVTLLFQGTVPPANTSAPQVVMNSTSLFDLIVYARNEFNETTLTASEVSMVKLLSGNCTASGMKWGCPAVSGDESPGIIITANPSGGYLSLTSPIIPFNPNFQSTAFVPLPYSLKIFTKDELGLDLVGGNVSTVSFGLVPCQVKNNSAVWGCPVAPGTSPAAVSVNPAASSGRLNYYFFGQTVPATVAGPQITNTSANRYTVRVNAKSEFGALLNVPGVLTTFSAGPCTNSSFSDWFCPVPASTSSWATVGLSGYVDFNSSFVSPATTGSQLAISSSNSFTILVKTYDAYGVLRDLRNGGAISFGTTSCVNSSSRIYDWGCPSPSGTFAAATISKPGFVAFTSAAATSPSPAGPQFVLNGSSDFSLRVIVNDELGANLTSAVLSVSNTSVWCGSVAGQLGHHYFCDPAVASPQITVSKSGFVTKSKTASGVDQESQTTVYFNTSDASAPQYSIIFDVRRFPNNAESMAEMSSGVGFFNFSDRAPLVPEVSLNNTYYFALPAGPWSVIINKTGYVERKADVNSSASSQTTSFQALDFGVRLDVRSKDGVPIATSVVVTPNATAQVVQDVGKSLYYLNLPTGFHLASVARPGFVTMNTPTIAVNTTYPNNQTMLTVNLPYTLEITSRDWGGLPLNGTTITISGQTTSGASQIVLSDASNIAYFDVDPTAYPAVNAIVSKSGYNTVGLTGMALSSLTQAANFTFHAQNVHAAVSDWSGTAVSGVLLTLYNNTLSAPVASCVTTSSGCDFLSVNGQSTPSDGFFNNTELTNASKVFLVTSKQSFGEMVSNPINYTYQAAENATAPLNLGTIKIGAKINVTVRQAWGANAPVQGATVKLLSSGIAIATNSTDSEGVATFIPNYTAAPSGSDYFVSGSETSDGTPLLLNASKAGYAPNATNLAFTSSTAQSFLLYLQDNVAPLVLVSVSGNNGTSYVGFETFNLSVSFDEQYGVDSSGVNFTASAYKIVDSAGQTVRAAAPLSGCAGSSCKMSGIDGANLPVGTLFALVNTSDVSGNLNSSNASILSRPGFNETAVSISKQTAYGTGTDHFLVRFDMSVKGDYSKLTSSNLNNTDCFDCDQFFINSWAGLVYRDQAHCFSGGNQISQVRDSMATSDTPATFCDDNLTTAYVRDQTVYLNFLVPEGLPVGKYNGTYSWLAGAHNLSKANVSITGLSIFPASPGTGANYTAYVTVKSSPLGATADDVVVNLTTAQGMPVYPPTFTISQIYSGQTATAVFNVTAPLSSNDSLSAFIASAIDGNTGLPATISPPASPGANTTNVTVTDTTGPLVTLFAPAAFANISSSQVSFSLSATDNLALSALAVYGNWSGGWGLKVLNSTPYNNSIWTTLAALADGWYVWAGFANDTTGNPAFSANRTFLVDTIFPAGLTYVAPTLANGSSVPRTYVEVNMTFAEANPASCVLQFNAMTNYTMALTKAPPANNYCFFNVTGQPNSLYTYFVSITDEAQNAVDSSVRTVTLDTVAPQFTSYAQNVTEFNASAGDAVLFSSSWIDNLALGSSFLSTNETGAWVNYTGATQGFTGGWSNFTWTNSTGVANNTFIGWQVWANDTAGNWNATAIAQILAVWP